MEVPSDVPAVDPSRSRHGEEPLAPVDLASALVALARCAVRTTRLTASGRLHQPDAAVGRLVRFADGTSARVYRETLVDRPPPRAPAVLVVAFRLRWVRHGWAHRLFRLESLLNTVLFAGFAGFVSKLWLCHDEHGRYRGLYQWDGPDLALAYVRALWWPLALLSEPPSITYRIVPGLWRDDLLEDPASLDALAGPDALAGAPAGSWWRLLPADLPGPASATVGPPQAGRDGPEPPS